MRSRSLTRLAAILSFLVLGAVAGRAFPVGSPPGNIVLDGSFLSQDRYWAGHAGYLGNWSTVPNNYGALVTDIHQDLSTVPGQQYALSFWAAADVYFGPSVTFSVNLNQQSLLAVATPPYAYEFSVNRFEQMHWQQVDATFVASSATTRLEFVDLTTPYFGLAAVSVVPVPEPDSVGLWLLSGAAMAGLRRWRKGRANSAQGSAIPPSPAR